METKITRKQRISGELYSLRMRINTLSRKFKFLQWYETEEYLKLEKRYIELNYEYLVNC